MFAADSVRLIEFKQYPCQILRVNDYFRHWADHNWVEIETGQRLRAARRQSL